MKYQRIMRGQPLYLLGNPLQRAKYLLLVHTTQAVKDSFVYLLKLAH